MSLASFLPAPKAGAGAATAAAASAPYPRSSPSSNAVSQPASSAAVPAYGSRSGFVPRRSADFGDGGAFPEIHRLQFPLGMGDKTAASGSALAVVSVDHAGSADYGAIVTQNQRSGKNVYRSRQDLVPKTFSQQELAKPDEEAVAETTQKTREALEKLVSGKIASSRPRHQSAKPTSGPVYVRYAPSKMGIDADCKGPEERIIRMHEMPVDPMEPPKFVHKKAPQGPPSPPVPIMHSPPRKLTVEDHQNWRIPPCISNWKNLRGYTIAADKRLASDGRGLVDTQINEKFASLSEAMYLAERNARAELQVRQQMESKIELKKREVKEEELRKLAQQAREKRAGLDRRVRQSEAYEDAGLDESAIDAMDEREELRRDVKRDLRRETRMSHMGTQARKSKMERDAQRDVSEQIALGKQVQSKGGESLFDQRLFNQSQGMSSGFGADDAYNAFDKPLFDKGEATRIYRPTKTADNEIYGGADVESIIEKGAGRFQPDRGFKGTESTAESRHESRAEPVQFERGDRDSLRKEPSSKDADPFALDQFLTDAKRGKALDHIGRSGYMKAAGGSGRAENYSSTHSGSMRFSEASASSSATGKRHRRDDDARRDESRRRRR